MTSVDALHIAAQCFEVAKENTRSDSFMKEYQEDVQRSIAKSLSSSDALTKIPFVTAEDYHKGAYQPWQLVRYRGLVLDVLDPEYYVGVYETIDKNSGERCLHSSYLREDIARLEDVDIDTEGEKSAICERHPFHLCPVPGESKWVKDFFKKRSPKVEPYFVQGHGVNINPKKRTQEQEQETGVTATGNEHASHERSTMARLNPSDDNSASAGNTEMEVSSSTSTATFSVSVAPLLAPYKTTGDDAPYCLAKLYGDQKSMPHLNEVVQIIGVLQPLVAGHDGPPNSSGSGLADEIERVMGDGFDDSQEQFPSSMHLPRIHAIAFQRLDSSKPIYLCDNSSLINSDRSHSHVSSTTPLLNGLGMLEGADMMSCSRSTPTLTPFELRHLSNSISIPHVRSSVIDAIVGTLSHCGVNTSQADMAAEYILLSCLSRVYHRQEGGLPLGTLPLNIIGCRGGDHGSVFARALEEILATFIPHCVRVRMSINDLNSGEMLAKKIYESNRLRPSLLQMAPGSIVILDETDMTQGALNNEGVRSLDVVKTFVTKQQLGIDYEYYQWHINVDEPTIIVSSTPTIVASEDIIQLKLDFSEAIGSSSNVVDSMTGQSAEHARYWWATCRNLEVKMNEATSKHAEDAFVRARQEDEKTMSFDFHRWLRLARLLAISYGDAFITTEHFDRAMLLDAKRKSILF
jgi:hypothetical protein